MPSFLSLPPPSFTSFCLPPSTDSCGARYVPDTVLRAEDMNYDPAIPPMVFSTYVLLWLLRIRSSCILVCLPEKEVASKGQTSCPAVFESNIALAELYGIEFRYVSR